VELLSSIATSQPHAAYTAFTHGLMNKWNFLTRTIPNTEEMFKPLEEKIRSTAVDKMMVIHVCIFFLLFFFFILAAIIGERGHGSSIQECRLDVMCWEEEVQSS